MVVEFLFEHLTSYENMEVNSIYNDCLDNFMNGKMTIQETRFLFQKKITAIIPDVAFDIVTNISDFNDSIVKESWYECQNNFK